MQLGNMHAESTSCRYKVGYPRQILRPKQLRKAFWRYSQTFHQGVVYAYILSLEISLLNQYLGLVIYNMNEIQ